MICGVTMGNVAVYHTFALYQVKKQLLTPVNKQNYPILLRAKPESKFEVTFL